MRKARLRRQRHRTIECLEQRLALAAAELVNDADTSLLLHFNNDLTGAAGETPTLQLGVTFPTGLLDQGAHIANPGRIRYATSGNMQGLEGTVEFWIKPDWNGNTSTNYAFLEVGDNFNNGMIMSIDAANNLRFLQWGDDPSTPAVETNVERGIGNSAVSWVAGTWHHLAATWNGTTRQMNFYVDGQSVGSVSNGIQINNFSTSYLSIGAEVGNQNSALATFDEVRISTRVRTAGEILSDYNRNLGLGSLAAPAGVAIGANDLTYVAESGAGRVSVFDAAGTPVTNIGTGGSGAGQLNQPWGVAIDASSDVFVVDRGNHRVQRFTSAGTYVSQFGSQGSAPGQFNSPQGIFVEQGTGLIYVADSANHRVERFLNDGTLDSTFGSGGVIGASGVVKRDHTGFDRPSAVAVNPATGELYVADFGNARLEVYSTSGVYLRTYLSVYRPNGMTFDAAGNLYIVGEDPNNNYQPYDGRLKLLRAGDTLLSEHFTGGLDDLGRTLYGVARKGDGKIVVADYLNSRLMQTDAELAPPLDNLSIDAHGTSATFRWRTRVASPGSVRFGTTSSYGTIVTDPTLATDHVVTVTGLTPNTRLYYGVSFADTFDQSQRFTPQDVMNTGVESGSAQFQRIKAVGLIYTDAQAGTGYTPISFLSLAEAHARFDRVADFYWRNSGFRLWLDIQVVEVNRDITTSTVSLFGVMASDLATLGFSAADDIDAVWGSSPLANGNFGGSATVFGRTVGMSQWVTQDDFVAIHEVNHSIDSIYGTSDMSKYEFNHGIWAVPGGVGRDVAINAQILRNLLPVNFTALKAPFTKILTAADSDDDGLPDSSPAGLTNPLSITEATLGSSTSLADSDSDGVSDRDEAMALPNDNTNLHSGDSDNDGRPDATDMNPAYPINDSVRRSSPAIDGVISDTDGWTVLSSNWGFSNVELVSDTNSLQSQTSTYAAWDDQNFYLALLGPANSTHIQLDGGADNWFFGSDNYDLTLSNSAFSRAVKINVGVPDLFRQIDNDGQYSEFFDTDAQFTKPYNGTSFYSTAIYGAGFPGRLVTESDLNYQLGGSGSTRVWEVAIPWSHVTGFQGFDGKVMALTIDVGGDRLFSVDHAAKIKLVDPERIPGDANGDGTVGAADYAIWAAQFGQTGPNLSADFDHSGSVGAADYALWAANFGRTAEASGAAAPLRAVPLAAIPSGGIVKSAEPAQDLRRVARSLASHVDARLHAATDCVFREEFNLEPTVRTSYERSAPHVGSGAVDRWEQVLQGLARNRARLERPSPIAAAGGLLHG